MAQPTAHDSLVATLMRMAAEQPVETIRVNKACEEAGISRATFYRIANSPAEVIVGEQRKIHEKRREDYARIMSVPGVDGYSLYVTQVSLVMADVWEYADIYRQSFSQNPSVLAGELLRFVQEGIEDFIRLRGSEINFPEAVRHLPEDERIRMLSTHFAHGEVGVIRAWIEQEGQVGIEDAVQAFFELAPAWYLEAIGYPGSK